jgi:hypothetical protein
VNAHLISAGCLDIQNSATIGFVVVTGYGQRNVPSPRGKKDRMEILPFIAPQSRPPPRNFSFLSSFSFEVPAFARLALVTEV